MLEAKHWSRGLREWRGRIFRGLLCLCICLGLGAGPATAEGVEVRGIRVATPDLGVTLKWGEEIVEGSLFLVARDGRGKVIESRAVAPFAGEFIEEILPGLLLAAPDYGPQVRVAVEDEFGAEVGRNLAFRLRLECGVEPESPCAFRVTHGLWAPESLVVSSALEAALLEVAGAEDLLAEVEDLFPELRGEAVTYAWQMAFLEDVEPAPPSGCVCRWTTRLDRRYDGCGGDCGAAHNFQVMVAKDLPVGPPACGGVSKNLQPLLQTFELGGSSELEVDVACSAPMGWGQQTVQVTGEAFEAWMSFPSLEMVDCASSCRGQIRLTATYEAKLEAAAELGIALARETASFAVDGGVDLFNVLWEVSTPLAGGSVGPAFFSDSGSQMTASGGVARVESLGFVDLRGAGGRSRGSIDSWIELEARAFSDCVGPKEIEIQVESERGAPPQGADVNILVGQCNNG